MQLSTMKLYTEPKLSPAQPKPSDMKKTWYVWFRFFDASNGTWKQLRYKQDLNKYMTHKERLIAANGLRQILKDGLRDGWNPLVKEQPETIVIYSIGEALDYVLKIKSATLRTKSKYAYTYIIASFKEWLEARSMTRTLTKQFTGSQAIEYMDWLLMKKKYSGRTFNDHLIVLRTFFNCFIEREWIVKNPFRAVKRKTQTIGRNLAYTDKEKAKLDKKLHDEDRRLYYFTQIMFHCFIRRTEMVCLKVKHIDLLNNSIIIPGENAKNNHQESVVIPKGLESVLQEMELHKYSSEDYVFGRRLLTCDKRYSNPNHVSTRHSKVVKGLNIDPEKGLYSHKHTGVCHYYQATKDPYAIMRQLRHRDMNTTMIYLKSMGLIQNDAFRNAKVA